jgi:hypothetical protein
MALEDLEATLRFGWDTNINPTTLPQDDKPDPVSFIDYSQNKIVSHVHAETRAMEAQHAQASLIELARKFKTDHEAIAKNDGLSPKGRQERLNKLALDTLAELNKHEEPAKHLDAAAESLTTRQNELLTPRKDVDPRDLAMEQEIRADLRRMDEVERKRTLLSAITNGDEQVLRAALNAPTYYGFFSLPEMRTQAAHALLGKVSPNLVARRQWFTDNAAVLRRHVGRVRSTLIAGLPPDLAREILTARKNASASV